jgi:hypothetical protein
MKALTGSSTLVLLVLAGCAGHAPAAKPPEKALCKADTRLNAGVPPSERTFPVQYWFALMLNGYRSSGEPTTPIRDCRGLPVEIHYDGCSPEPAGQADVARPLAATDVLIANLGDARRLVWIMTTRLPDGQAQGPVALAEITSTGIAVRAMGVLRAYPDRARLRLLQLGGGSVLVAEGEHCPGRLDPSLCDRGLRIMPLIGDRFESRPLTRADGQCMASSLIVVRTGGRRDKGASYEFESAVSFSPDAVSVEEQLSVHTTPTKREKETGDAFVTKIQAARRLVLQGDHLVASDVDLLGRWLTTNASESE